MESIYFQLFLLPSARHRVNIPTPPPSFFLYLAFTPSHELHCSPRMMMLTIPLTCDNCPGVALEKEQHWTILLHIYFVKYGLILSHLMLWKRYPNLTLLMMQLLFGTNKKMWNHSFHSIPYLYLKLPFRYFSLLWLLWMFLWVGCCLYKMWERSL